MTSAIHEILTVSYSFEPLTYTLKVAGENSNQSICGKSCKLPEHLCLQDPSQHKNP